MPGKGEQPTLLLKESSWRHRMLIAACNVALQYMPENDADLAINATLHYTNKLARISLLLGVANLGMSEDPRWAFHIASRHSTFKRKRVALLKLLITYSYFSPSIDMIFYIKNSVRSFILSFLTIFTGQWE